MAPAHRARLSPLRQWVKAMGMNTAPAPRAHRKDQADRKRHRHLVVTGVVRVAVDLAAAVLVLVGVAAAVVAAVDDRSLSPQRNGPRSEMLRSPFLLRLNSTLSQ